MANLCGELRRQGKCNNPKGKKCIVACSEWVKLNRIKRKLEKLLKK